MTKRRKAVSTREHFDIAWQRKIDRPEVQFEVIWDNILLLLDNIGIGNAAKSIFVEERCITNIGEFSLSLNTKTPAPPQLPCCVKVIPFCVLSLRPVLCLFVGQRHPGRLSAGINLRAGFSPI